MRAVDFVATDLGAVAFVVVDRVFEPVDLVAGALVADAVMDIYDIEELEICPWALREGIILERLDQMSVLFRG